MFVGQVKRSGLTPIQISSMPPSISDETVSIADWYTEIGRYIPAHDRYSVTS